MVRPDGETYGGGAAAASASRSACADGGGKAQPELGHPGDERRVEAEHCLADPGRVEDLRVDAGAHDWPPAWAAAMAAAMYGRRSGYPVVAQAPSTNKLTPEI